MAALLCVYTNIFIVLFNSGHYVWGKSATWKSEYIYSSLRLRERLKLHEKIQLGYIAVLIYTYKVSGGEKEE